jgi:origin recognition complex subunit 4
MLVGNSGTGKTMTINRCLKALSLKYGSGSFKTISLNGNIQRGDTAALKEITRQLASHDTSRAYTTADEHMKFFYDTLKEQSAAGIPLILVLDFFEGFVRAQSKQTLLYNLFDLMQSGNHRLVVIGASRHLDVTDDLEKRIMSRFSSRQLLFENHNASDGVKVLQQRLLLPDNSPFELSYITEFNSKVTSLLDSSALSLDGDRGRDHLSTLQVVIFPNFFSSSRLALFARSIKTFHYH